MQRLTRRLISQYLKIYVFIYNKNYKAELRNNFPTYTKSTHLYVWLYKMLYKTRIFKTKKTLRYIMKRKQFFMLLREQNMRSYVS